MRRIWTTAVVVASTLAAGLLVPTTADATPKAKPDTSLSFASEAGDVVGGGRTGHFDTSDSQISFSGSATAGLGLTVTRGDENWAAHVIPGAGDVLRPGVFAGAERAPFQTGRAPGLEIYGGGSGCTWLSGSFVVDQIAFDASGRITMADVSLVQHCEDATPAITATLHINALPLDFAATMPRTGAPTKTYTNGTSLLSASPSVGSTTGELHVRVSGLGDVWDLRFAPPTGTAFVQGRVYKTVGSTPDATHASLAVVDGTGCAANPGTLRIDRLTLKNGVVTALAMTFTARCYADQPKASGSLHYFA